MATLDEIGEEKQRVCERLARFDTERARLADQLNELEIADRVLTVVGRRGLRTRRRRENLAATAPAGGEPSARGGRQMGTVAVRDAVLKAVEARPQGATASEVLEYVSQEFLSTSDPSGFEHRKSDRSTSSRSAAALAGSAALPNSRSASAALSRQWRIRPKPSRTLDSAT